MRRTLILLNLYSREAVWHKLKKSQKCIFNVFRLFGTYVRQSHNYIGWAKSMSFTSINSTNPRTNPWNFGNNCSAFSSSWKTQFFWVAHFGFFFALSQSKLVNIYRIARIFQNFDDYSDFQKNQGVYRNMRHTVQQKLLKTLQMKP
jgi:hypothetical protein